MINLDYSGKRRGTDFGRALARLLLATAIAGGAALAVGDGTVFAALSRAFGS
jgi:hypothetical protein